MRAILIVILAALAVLAGVFIMRGLESQAGAPQALTVERARLMSMPSAESGINCSVAGPAQAEILETDRFAGVSWARVAVDGCHGWIQSSAIQR